MIVTAWILPALCDKRGRLSRRPWVPHGRRGTAFAAAVREHRSDVAVVDVRMPPSHTDEGIRAAVDARREHLGLAVLVLSAYVEQSFATDLLADGARSVGYLLKERVGRVDTFVSALRRVAAGGTAMTPRWWRSCSPGSAVAIHCRS